MQPESEKLHRESKSSRDIHVLACTETNRPTHSTHIPMHRETQRLWWRRRRQSSADKQMSVEAAGAATGVCVILSKALSVRNYTSEWSYFLTRYARSSNSLGEMTFSGNQNAFCILYDHFASTAICQKHAHQVCISPTQTVKLNRNFNIFWRVIEIDGEEEAWLMFHPSCYCVEKTKQLFYRKRCRRLCRPTSKGQ